MANFNLTITNEGAAFLADIIANQGTIHFSEVRFSSTNYVGSEATLTEGTFAGTFITATPSASVVDSTTINVASSFDNSTFTADMSLYSIGIIADDGNGNDALVAVCTTSTPQILSKFILTASTYAYNVNLAVSDTDQITVTSSMAGVVMVADIIDNLTSTYVNKPLSANQGKVLKDLIDQGTGMKPHIVITSDTGSTVTLTLGGDTVTATETSSGVFEADVNAYGTWTISSVLNGDTVTDTLAVDIVKIYTVTLMHFSATITVTYPVGATCTCAKDGETLTADTNPYTFTVSSAGSWVVTATDGVDTDTETVVISTSGQSESITLSFVPDGRTVTPTDDIQIWLHCGDIWDKNYTTIAEVLTDGPTLLALISDANAVDYLVRSTTWATDACSDANFMTDVGAKNYAADTLIADITWLTAIANSAYIDKVLTGYVPDMTSANTPSGIATWSSVFSSYYGWYAFSSGVERWLTTSKTDQWLAYDWGSDVPPVKCIKMMFALTGIETAPKNMRADAYRNGAYVQLDSFTYTGSADSGSLTQILQNSDDQSKMRLYIVDSVDGSRSYLGVNRLQFYYRIPVAE